MRRIQIVALALLMAVVGCRSAEVETTETTPAPVIVGQPAPSLTNASALPIGTTLEVTLSQTIGTKTNQVGDRFTATVAQPLVTTTGAVAVPQGAVVHGTITGLDDSDHPGDQAYIRLSFDQLTWSGRTHALAADIVSADVRTEREEVIDPERAAVAGAALGAAIGAIISGAELAKILAGAAIGAGAGTVVSLGLGDVEASLPAGSRMTLRTTETVLLQ